MWISHLFQLTGVLDFIFPKQKSILNIYKIMLCCYQLSGVETWCEGVNASNKNLLPSLTAITFKNTAADWKPSTHALETVSCSKNVFLHTYIGDFRYCSKPVVALIPFAERQAWALIPIAERQAWAQGLPGLHFSMCQRKPLSLCRCTQPVTNTCSSCMAPCCF